MTSEGRNSSAPVKLRGRGRSRDYIRCRAGAHYCPIVVKHNHHTQPSSSSFTTLHDPFPTSRRNFTSIHCIRQLHCAHQHRLKQNPSRASLPAYHTPSLKAITSLLGNICFQEHTPNYLILPPSRNATNLHPGAHQDHQKTFVRHAS